MKVLDIMRREVRSISPQCDLAEAGRIMAEVECGFLPVVAPDGRVVGVVTDRDCALVLARLDRKPSLVQAREAMSPEVYGCAPQSDIREAIRWMACCKVRRLIVFDDARHLLGLLSLDDVVLHTRTFGDATFDGPFHVDVGKALKAICAHEMPALRA